MTFPALEELSDSGGVGITGQMMRGHGRGWPCHVMKRTKPSFGPP
jgi:hypothetical protein